MKNYNDFIKLVPSELKKSVEILRELILNSSKDMNEEIKWGSPTYYINKHICSLHSHKEHLNLQFFYGANLKNTELLAGTGKSMRHLKIKTPKDIVESHIKLLMKEAIEFDKQLKKSKSKL